MATRTGWPPSPARPCPGPSGRRSLMALAVLVLGEPMLMLFGPGFDAGYPLLFLLVARRRGARRRRPLREPADHERQPEHLRAGLCADAGDQYRPQRGADPALRPVGRGHRHRLRHDLRGQRAVLHRLAQARHRHGDLHAATQAGEPPDGRHPASRGNQRRPGRHDDVRPRRPARRDADPAHVELARQQPARCAGWPSIRHRPASTWSRNWTISAPAPSSRTSSSTRASWRRPCRGWRIARCGWR